MDTSTYELSYSVKKLTDRIVSVMNGNVYGIWLYGSVVMDDFRLGWSDIDFIALTNETVTESEAQSLLELRQKMLDEEPRNPYYRTFEGIIVGVDEYRNSDFIRLVYWGTSGQKITDSYTTDPFSEFELAKYGKNVFGDKPWILPAPNREEMIRAIRKHYEAMRRYAVVTDRSIYSCGWLLDIARCIYTLRNNDVISKTEAGRWALDEHLFENDAPLKKTLEIRLSPLKYKDSEETGIWLENLGIVVQSYADVLEEELKSQ